MSIFHSVLHHWGPGAPVLWPGGQLPGWGWLQPRLQDRDHRPRGPQGGWIVVLLYDVLVHIIFAGVLCWWLHLGAMEAAVPWSCGQRLIIIMYSLLIVCVNTFNSETKTSYSYSIFVVITIHLNVRHLSDLSTFSVVIMAKVWPLSLFNIYTVFTLK